jgi:release factor glutamine methyltransferase
MYSESAKELFDYLASSIKIYERNEATSIAYLIMEHFGIKKTDISLDKKIQNIDLKKTELIIKRLNQAEPIQYILGETEFFGRKFKVNQHVLIPRQETEELVDKIIKENRQNKKLKILDIGTGSGCIAITLAKELPDSEVHAIDISEEALEITAFNATKNKATINFYKQDIIQHSTFNIQHFNLIVSNPPYVTESEKKLMHENVLKHEPSLALFVEDEDPLKFYTAILKFAKIYLSKNGKCYFEINEAFGEEIFKLFEENGFKKINISKDLNGKSRIASGELN